MAVQVKTIYLPAAKADGYRIPVDRLWPRGVKKEAAKIDTWMKEISPSTDLRNWFNHEPEKWKHFIEKYQAELKGSAALTDLRALIREHSTVIL